MPLLAPTLLLLSFAPRANVEPLATLEKEDAELHAAWATLDADERMEIAEWFRAEVEGLGTLQGRLVARALARQDRDPGLWPVAEHPPLFDPEKHAPAQPTPRTWLEPDDPEVKDLAERIFVRVPERKLESGWSYDYISRELRRTGPLRDPERIFKNALAGFGPDTDLAEALIERELDTGAERAALEAFLHGYTDRAGNAYPGITLYDAWCSGARMEMPDIDCLGIVHTLLDDWTTWRAPIASSKHRRLYDRIAGLFEPAHRYRGLRRGLARLYASGRPVLRDGYAGRRDRLHALWDTHAGDAKKLAEELPGGGEDWTSYLDEWTQKTDDDKQLFRAGEKRRKTLEADEAKVRATIERILQEFGAFDRVEGR